jgi:hypothetical protein
LKNIAMPVVWVFPGYGLVNCGTAEFAVSEAELHLFKDNTAAAG